MPDHTTVDRAPCPEFADRLEADLLRVLAGGAAPRSALTGGAAELEDRPVTRPRRFRLGYSAAAAALVAAVAATTFVVTRHDDRPATTVPTAPSQDDIQCGAMITHDVVLTHDLDCDGTSALTVATDGLTLDLGGHTLSGSATYGVHLGVANGTRITNGVRVTNGTLRNFDVGVWVDFADGSRVDNVVVEGDGDETVAIGVNRSVGVLVDHNTIRGTRGAIFVIRAASTVLLDNSVTDTVDGISLDDQSTDNVIAGNVLERASIAVGGNGSRNLIEGNTLTNPSDGIILDEASHNVVSGNVVVDSEGFGLLVQSGDCNHVHGNEISGSAGDAILVDETSDGNVTVNNLVDGVMVDTAIATGDEITECDRSAEFERFG